MQPLPAAAPRQYNTCEVDCKTSSRPLPPMSLNHRDAKWCATFDSMRATSVGSATRPSETVNLQYTISQFGQGIPPEGLTLSLSAAKQPHSACEPITDVDDGGDVSPLAAASAGVDGIGMLATIYDCEFVVKAQHVEDWPDAKLAIISNVVRAALARPSRCAVRRSLARFPPLPLASCADQSVLLHGGGA